MLPLNTKKASTNHGGGLFYYSCFLLDAGEGVNRQREHGG